MKILITGATGFVGRNFVRTLCLSCEYEIVLVVRDVQKSKLMFLDINCTYINTDKLDEIEKSNPDIVFHLASYISSRNDKNIIDEVLISNIIFGVKFLDALKNCDNLKLFVNIGTFAEYRFGANYVYNAYLYSTTKTAFKQFVEYYSQLCGYKYIHVVPYTIYGGEDSQKKIMDYIIDSFNSETPVNMSEGEQVLDFIHVNDVVSFFVFIINSLDKLEKLSNGKVIHLGTGRGHSIRELASILEVCFNKRANIAWGNLPYREMDVLHAVAPIGELIDMGWSPRITLSEGVKDFIR